MNRLVILILAVIGVGVGLTFTLELTTKILVPNFKGFTVITSPDWTNGIEVFIGDIGMACLIVVFMDYLRLSKKEWKQQNVK